MFVHSYWDAIPTRFNALPPVQAYCIYATILLPMAHTPGTVHLVRGSPGIRRIFAHWWACILDNDGVVKHEGFVVQPDGWNELGQLLLFFTQNIEDESNYEDIVEGAGGLSRFASLLLKHTNLALDRPSGTDMVKEGAVMAAVKLVESRRDRGGPFDTAILSEGWIQALVRSVPVLDSFKQDVRLGGHDALGLVVLCDYLSSKRLDKGIVQALQAGLLEVMVSFGATVTSTANGDETGYKWLHHLLTELLPGGLLYYGVAREMKIQFPTVRIAAAAPEFTKSAIFDA
ncbi:hypothetical protein B0H16DRAFT_165125 [Mycena metata]|uniref:Uncharacterized protein n=1 Tax=Mycena metata TaxID=1033252 RepID=A0AAD7JUL2_9AGAR|nr:hypothetical protein B0H16DRAFT_165125 [Mycena metata]